MGLPMVNQDRRIIDVFPPAYDEYCTPYRGRDFSEEIRDLSAMKRPVKLQPCKAIFIGDVSVGKTTIVNRFCFDRFQDSYKATIGVDFEVENFEILGHSHNLQIWDTAGQERFKCIAQAYYRSTNGKPMDLILSKVRLNVPSQVIVIVFDMTKEETLQATTTWLESALAVNSIQKPLIFLVGSKSDLLSKNEFIAMETQSYEIARGMRAEYWSVSARTAFNIVELFQRIASLSFESMMKQALIETQWPSETSEPIKMGFFHGWTKGFECNVKDKSSKSNRCLC